MDRAPKCPRAAAESQEETGHAVPERFWNKLVFKKY
jgi:hypothetical protein